MPRYGHNKSTKKRESWNVKESTLRLDEVPDQRLSMNIEDFDRLVKQQGVKAKIYRTSYCPNVKSADSANHEIDCQLCEGSGFIDLDPIETTVFIQNQDLEKVHNKEGFIDANTVAITFPVGVELQYFTKIELLDFTDIYIQRLLRASGTDTDILKYSACRVNFIVASDGTRYYQEQDFNIDQNGDIKWGSNKPADNVVYSIHYEAAVQYRATAAMHVNRFLQVRSDGGKVEFIKAPEQWTCTKEFLVKRLDQDGNELIQGPYDDHTVTDDNDPGSAL